MHKRSFFQALQLKWPMFAGVLAAVFTFACRGETGSQAGVRELQLWHLQTSAPMPEIIQGSIDRYNAANPQYHVTAVPTANDAYKQKLSIAVASGQIPEIFASWSGGTMREYIKAGHIQDITEQMSRNNYKDLFLDAGIAQGTYEGKIYGVPVENVAIASVWYNTEMFAEYGLSVPTTISELEAVCDTLIAQGKIPFALANKTQWTGSMYYMNLVTRYGGLEPFQRAASSEGSFEAEAFAFAGSKIQEWVDKGYFNPGFNGADEDAGQSRQLLYTGDAAMVIMGTWFAAVVKGENPEFYQKVGTFNFPAVDGSAADPSIVVGTVGDNFYHVSSAAAGDVDAAFAAITALLDEEAVSQRLAAGKIVPMKGVPLDDPLLQAVMSLVDQASDVQLWYDQYLPPEIADLHKRTLQQVFGKTMTPQDADRAMQEAMSAYNSHNNS